MSESVTLDEHVAGAVDRFASVYGSGPTHAAAAPGRVNLIGEHTDYNDGFVLPMAIERRTLALARRRDDMLVRLTSTGMDERVEIELTQPLRPGKPQWANYVRGVIAGCREAGLEAGGMDLLIDSTVPTGGGLSSSAALEVATATLIEAMTGRQLGSVNKALLCQKAEHSFAGMPCGIMDQFIAVLGEAGRALLIDCRSHETRPVPLDDPGVAVLIVNSNVKHELGQTAYPQRRRECEAAAKALGVRALRDAGMQQLDARYPDGEGGEGNDAVVYRRARHVIRENERTVTAAEAMAQRDWKRVGELMLASHRSLRDDFEVSCPELDTLVDLAMRHAGEGGVYGSRMTGGGFGGCTVSLVRAEAVERVGAAVAEGYARATGIQPSVFATRAGEGAQVVEV